MSRNEHELWLSKADDDLEWCRASLREKIYYGSCFVAQQAAEKALKAYLLFKAGKFGRIHDLVKLIDSCANFDKDFLSFRSKIAKLSFYYVQVRYPDIGDVDSYTQEEANEAYQLSIELVEFVGKKIKKTR